MANTPISLTTGTVQIQSIGSQTNTQGSPNVPSQLAGVSIGSLISGFVINRDRGGNPILRTERGDVLVQSDVFLKTGSEVIIRIQTQAQQTVAKIISVDNIPLQEFINQRAEPVNEDVVLQSSSSSASKLSTANGIPLAEDVQIFQTSALEAVLLRAPVSASSTSNATLLASVFNIPLAAATAIEEGGIVQLRVVSTDLTPITNAVADVVTPKAGTVASLYQAYQSPALPAAGAPTASASPSTLPALPAAPLTVLPHVTPLPLTQAQVPTPTANTPQPLGTSTLPVVPAGAPIIQPAVGGIIPPATTAPVTPTTTPTPTSAPVIPALANPHLIGSSPATDLVSKATESAIAAAASQLNPQVALGQKSGVISATVIGHELGGETIVRTSVGSFKLFTPSPPPAGTTLQLQLIAIPSPLQAGTIAYQNQLFERAASQPQDLTSLQELVALAQTNPALASELATRLPNTKSKLVNNALFFLSALKSGDVRSWLGQNLSDKLEELAPQLFSKLSSELGAARAGAEAPNQPWQPLHFPLLHQQELQQPKLFIRQDESDKSTQKAQGIRFILDVNFSELGDMQMDGFVRNHNRKTQFDLIVRSHEPLEIIMQQDITQLFTQAAELTGFEGSVRFQPDPASFVNAAEANLQAKWQDDRSIIA